MSLLEQEGERFLKQRSTTQNALAASQKPKSAGCSQDNIYKSFTKRSRLGYRSTSHHPWQGAAVGCRRPSTHGHKAAPALPVTEEPWGH